MKQIIPGIFKVFLCDENSTSMHPWAAQNWVPIFVYIDVFFGFFLGKYFVIAYSSRVSLFLRTNVTKTDLTTLQIAARKVVDFDSIRFQRMRGNFFKLKLVPVRQEASNLERKKFKLRRNSTISWTARCLISDSADISLTVTCRFSLISSPNSHLLW